MVHTSLISGLPDDLALVCLARVPRRYHHILKCVSRKWKELVCSEDWWAHRKKLNIEEPWIYALCRDSLGRICLFELDPSRRRWKPIQGVPPQCVKRKGMACQALGKKLYLLGGCGWLEDATREVYCYDISANTWEEPAPMSIARCYCACEALNGKLYAIGGVGLASSDLTSWDAYDPQLNIWTSHTDSHLFPDVEESITFDGKIYIRRGGWTPSAKVVSLMYDPLSIQMWQPVASNMVSDWLGPTIVVDGTLYMLDQSSGVKLMVWRSEIGDWVAVGRLSPWLTRPPCQLVAIGRRIFVIGKELGTVILDVDKVGNINGVMVSSSIPKLEGNNEIVCCKAVAI